MSTESLTRRMAQLERKKPAKALSVIIYRYGQQEPTHAKGQQLICKKCVNLDGSIEVADEYRNEDGSYYNEAGQLEYGTEYNYEATP